MSNEPTHLAPDKGAQIELSDESPLERPPIYDSPSMRERRHRILKETRSLIASKGIENFSVRELTHQAGVALRTLYNTFYSKDRLIAVAIREAYDEIEERVRYSMPATTIEGIIERLVTVNQRNFKARNYTVAVTALYFAPNTPIVVWETLQEIALKNLKQWVNHTAAKGDFHDWIDPDSLAHDIVNLEFAIISDWANNRISDEKYLRRLVDSVLCFVAGAVRGSTQESVERMFRHIHNNGDLPSFPKAVWAPK